MRSIKNLSLYILACLFHMKYELEKYVIDLYFNKKNYFNEYKYALDSLSGSNIWSQVIEPYISPP